MISIQLFMHLLGFGLAGLMILAGVLLCGAGAVALVRERRRTGTDAPSYSSAVEYPSEDGVPRDFEDTPRWAYDFAEQGEDAEPRAAAPARQAWWQRTGNRLLLGGGLLLVAGLVLLYARIQLLF